VPALLQVRKTKTYTTEEDFQTSIDCEVYEGERSCTDGNNKLGHFTISGLQRAKRGVPQINVTFDIDANGPVVAAMLQFAVHER
jgi:molecular chaperone DnaK (HSP70)